MSNGPPDLMEWTILAAVRLRRKARLKNCFEARSVTIAALEAPPPAGLCYPHALRFTRQVVAYLCSHLFVRTKIDGFNALLKQGLMLLSTLGEHKRPASRDFDTSRRLPVTVDFSEEALHDFCRVNHLGIVLT